jgi:glycerate-2-kinase
VKNISQLLSEELDMNILSLRKTGLKLLEIALEAVKPQKLIKNSIRVKGNTLIIENDEFELKKYENIYIIGGGKATAEMASTLEYVLENIPNLKYKGSINIPEGLDINDLAISEKIKINYASHPIPNENGLNGVKSMMEMIKNSTNKDLVFCLISGGGSALLPLPKENIDLLDLKKLNSHLIASGASIHEINAIRKHLSDFKGGNLAKTLYNLSGAKLITLIISDVVGNDLDTIASGPSVPDSTTFKEALRILKKYNIQDKIPSSILKVLQKGLSNEISENPKFNDKCFNNVNNYLIGSVKNAVDIVIESLKEQSYKVEYFSSAVLGEARDYGNNLFNIMTKTKNEKMDKQGFKKLALIGTGELIVTIKGTGIGGRNQEMLLSFLENARDKNFPDNFLIIGVNLDGIEGNSNAMGALLDNKILNKIVREEIDTKSYLDNNDSNSFFKKIKTEIITGPTGCNVNDLIIVLIQK